MTSSSLHTFPMPIYNSRRTSSGISSQYASEKSSGSLFRSSEINGSRQYTPLNPVDRPRPDREYPGMRYDGMAHNEIEDDHELMDETVLSIDVKERCIGCCYYTTRNETMYFMEDMKMGGTDIIDTCKGG